MKKILALKEYWSLVNEISDYLRDHDTITTIINGVEYAAYKRLNSDYVEFLNNETKEVTFIDIIDEPTEVSSLLVQSAVNSGRMLRRRKKRFEKTPEPSNSKFYDYQSAWYYCITQQGNQAFCSSSEGIDYDDQES